MIPYSSFIDSPALKFAYHFLYALFNAVVAPIVFVASAFLMLYPDQFFLNYWNSPPVTGNEAIDLTNQANAAMYHFTPYAMHAYTQAVTIGFDALPKIGLIFLIVAIIYLIAMAGRWLKDHKHDMDKEMRVVAEMARLWAMTCAFFLVLTMVAVAYANGLIVFPDVWQRTWTIIVAIASAPALAGAACALMHPGRLFKSMMEATP